MLVNTDAHVAKSQPNPHRDDLEAAFFADAFPRQGRSARPSDNTCRYLIDQIGNSHVGISPKRYVQLQYIKIACEYIPRPLHATIYDSVTGMYVLIRWVGYSIGLAHPE